MPMIEIPGYSIESELGRGGMASVYLAVQEMTKRKVAIKIMSPELAADPSFSQRFLKEATCAQLEHSNIVTIYDAGTVGNQSYIVMEHASGGDLSDKIKQGLTIYESIKIIKQIASALGYAHEKHYVHRDVKPDNVLFRADGSAVLTDFGIAKATSSNTKMTAVGMAIGSPHYMSPEQARGRELDGRSDIYSLGIAFYEMLMGVKPYDAEDTYAIGYMHINEDIPRLEGEDRIYLQPVLEKMLAKDPADRYANAVELIDALDNVQPPPGPEREAKVTELMNANEHPGSSKGRSGLGVFAAVGAVLAVSAFAVVYFFQADLDNEAPVVSQPIVEDAKTLKAENSKEEEIRKAQADEALKNKIAMHLERAADYFQKSAIIAPAGENAFDEYDLVLGLDAGNRKARNGKEDIIKKLANDIDIDIKKNSFDKAQVKLNQALEKIPESSRLKKLKARLLQARNNYNMEVQRKQVLQDQRKMMDEIRKLQAELAKKDSQSGNSAANSRVAEQNAMLAEIKKLQQQMSQKEQASVDNKAQAMMMAEIKKLQQQLGDKEKKQSENQAQAMMMSEIRKLQQQLAQKQDNSAQDDAQKKMMEEIRKLQSQLSQNNNNQAQTEAQSKMMQEIKNLQKQIAEKEKKSAQEDAQRKMMDEIRKLQLQLAETESGRKETEAQRKMMGEIESLKQQLAMARSSSNSKDVIFMPKGPSLKLGKHGKITILARFTVGLGSYTNSRAKAKKLSQSMKLALQEYVPSNTVIEVNNKDHVTFELLEGDKEEKISELCSNNDYVFAGLLEDGYMGTPLRDMEYFMHNCETGKVKNVSFPTNKGERNKPLMRNLKSFLKKYVDEQTPTTLSGAALP